jgi:hypothetical protein
MKLKVFELGGFFKLNAIEKVTVIYFIEKYLYGWTTTASTPLKIFGATFINLI